MAYYDKEYGSLYIGPEKPTRDRKGRYIKGNVAHNRGKKWDDFLSKEKQEHILRCASKGREKIAQKGRSPNAGRPKRPVIMVMGDGMFHRFDSVGAVQKWSNGIFLATSVRFTCQINQQRRKCKRTGLINTDYRLFGVRFYYEDDDIWMEKINEKYRI